MVRVSLPWSCSVPATLLDRSVSAGEQRQVLCPCCWFGFVLWSLLSHCHLQDCTRGCRLITLSMRGRRLQQHMLWLNCSRFWATSAPSPSWKFSLSPLPRECFLKALLAPFVQKWVWIQLCCACDIYSWNVCCVQGLLLQLPCNLPWHADVLGVKLGTWGAFPTVALCYLSTLGTYNITWSETWCQLQEVLYLQSLHIQLFCVSPWPFISWVPTEWSNLYLMPTSKSKLWIIVCSNKDSAALETVLETSLLFHRYHC